MPEIAAHLHVDAVVEGSVERDGQQVRIRVELVDARQDRQLWSNTYDRDLRDVLALEAAVAHAIADEMKGTLTPPEEARLTSRQPVDREAHERDLRGRYLLAKGTEQSINTAIGYFNQAIARSPTYARPYAGLADAYTQLRSTYLPPHVVMPKAKAAA